MLCLQWSFKQVQYYIALVVDLRFLWRTSKNWFVSRSMAPKHHKRLFSDTSVRYTLNKSNMSIEWTLSTETVWLLVLFLEISWTEELIQRWHIASHTVNSFIVLGLVVYLGGFNVIYQLITIRFKHVVLFSSLLCCIIHFSL